ncbi:MAG: type II toxin-antitoxin system MqsA family antitoxin [Nitrospinales bacterium]
MSCHNCGGNLEETVTDLPFKTGPSSIVIIKKLPVAQCQNCGEYLLEDPVMKKVDAILGGIDHDVELEILTYAA